MALAQKNASPVGRFGVLFVIYNVETGRGENDEKIVTIAFIFILLFSTRVLSEEGHSGFTKHYEKRLFKVTEKGSFSAEMFIKYGELKIGSNTVDIIIHDRNDRDVVGADIEVIPWMPEHGHGLPTEPIVTEELGEGYYLVEGMKFNMPGWWLINFSIKAGDKEDIAIFNLYLR